MNVVYLFIYSGLIVCFSVGFYSFVHKGLVYFLLRVILVYFFSVQFQPIGYIYIYTIYHKGLVCTIDYMSCLSKSKIHKVGFQEG